jgi:hypothetical protein
MILIMACVKTFSFLFLYCLNPVRVRAGLPASTETDQALLRDIIAHERDIELAFENKR